MSTDPNELVRGLRNGLAARSENTVRPGEGKIVTGVVSTRDLSVRAGEVRAERPPLTPLEALFSDEDPEGTHYYMATTGVLNTVRADGTRIEFVRGVYKTANPEDIEILEYLKRRGDVKTVLPPETETNKEESKE